MTIRSLTVATLFIGSMVAFPVGASAGATETPCFWAQFDPESLTSPMPNLVWPGRSLPLRAADAVKVEEAAACRESGGLEPECGGLPAIAWFTTMDGTPPLFYNGIADDPPNVHFYVPVVVLGQAGHDATDVYAILCFLGGLVDFVIYMQEMIVACTIDFVESAGATDFQKCLEDGIDNAP